MKILPRKFVVLASLLFIDKVYRQIVKTAQELWINVGPNTNYQ